MSNQTLPDMDKIDTPRVNSVCEKLFYDNGPDSGAPSDWICCESSAGEIADFARTLERELSASQERVRELEADANRYRKVRSGVYLAGDGYRIGGAFKTETPYAMNLKLSAMLSDFDSAVDAALKEKS